MIFLRYKDLVNLSDIQILMLSDEMHWQKQNTENLDNAMTVDTNLYLLEGEMKRRGINAPDPEPVYRPISYRRKNYYKRGGVRY